MTMIYQWHLQGAGEQELIPISFTITRRRGSPINCKAIEGMTWEQFVLSGMEGSSECLIDGSRITHISGDLTWVHDGNGFVKVTDVVINGFEYSFAYDN